MGKLYLPKNMSYTADIVSECLHFPMGTHDDIVDALSLLGRVLDTTFNPSFSVIRNKRRDLRYGTNVIESAREFNDKTMRLRRA